MKFNIQRWGNSAAIRIPAPMLAQIGATVGDTVEVDLAAFHVAKPQFALADLIAQCNPAAPAPSDAAAWENMVPVGLESA